MSLAQIHRFRESVAIYLAGGKTIYLSPKEAKAIAKALNAAARDIKANPFVESGFSTVVVELIDKNA